MYIDADVDPEEKYDRHIFSILKKIKDELLRNSDQPNLVKYRVFLHPIIKKPFIPHPTDEQKLLSQLERTGIYTQLGELVKFETGIDSRGQPDTVGFELTLKVNLDIFNPEYEKYKTKVAHYDEAGNEKLIIERNNGKIITTYQTKTGSKYKAIFKQNSNEGLLLSHFANKPGFLFSVNELEEVLKDIRTDADSPDPYKRINDTIGYLRKKLKLLKGMELFIVSNGFGIKNIDVEIRKPRKS